MKGTWSIMAFSYRPVFCSRFDKLIPKQKHTGSTAIPQIVQNDRNNHFCTEAVIDNVEDMVIEGVKEELQLEAGRPLKQELLVTPPTKRSKPNVSTIFKNAVSRSRSLSVKAKRVSC